MPPEGMNTSSTARPSPSSNKMIAQAKWSMAASRSRKQEYKVQEMKRNFTPRPPLRHVFSTDGADQYAIAARFDHDYALAPFDELAVGDHIDQLFAKFGFTARR